MNEHIATFLREMEFSLATTTLQHYRVVMTRFDEYRTLMGHDGFTRNNVVNFLLDSKLKLSISFVSQMESILKAFYSWLADSGVIPGNPINSRRQIVPYRSPLRPKDFAFTEKEYHKIRDYCKKEKSFWYGAVIIAWNTGLRLKDVAEFHFDSCDFDQKIIKVTPSKSIKQQKVLEIPMTPELYSYLVKRFVEAANGHVLPEMYRRYHSGGNGLPNDFTKICQRLLIYNKSFHSFRHSMTSRLLNKSVPLSVIGSITGQGIQVLDRYSHVSMEQKKEALNA